ncbi:probable aquaporin TIP-type [Gastrolobium bilobum]|uniref:probable aquaporin TIP-type n=1 Tax=Gastrolobium bilobum TaxID=150636 RepID=UPI002AB126A0|nr:probable aquaporin TIP-type [Gastrolobium bilobum]
MAINHDLSQPLITPRPRSTWDNIVAAVYRFWNFVIVEHVLLLWNFVVDRFRRLWNSVIVEPFTRFWNFVVVEPFRRLRNFVVDCFRRLRSIIVENVRRLWNSFPEPVRRNLRTFFEAVRSLWSKVAGPVSRFNRDHRRSLMAGVAEFMSTFIFVFVGSGSSMAVNKLNGDKATDDGLISTAIAHALAFIVSVSISTGYSSGHVNPAVSLGAFIGGNITIQRCVLYWFAQLLASIVACAVLMLATTGQSLPVFGFSEGVKVKNAVVLEMVMTFTLAYTVYATSDDTQLQPDKKDTKGTKKKKTKLRIIAPIVIGFIVGANVMVGGVFDGASMNPALSFGPALLSWKWAGHWVYWVGPVVGAASAGFIYEMVYISSGSSGRSGTRPRR